MWKPCLIAGLMALGVCSCARYPSKKSAQSPTTRMAGENLCYKIRFANGALNGKPAIIGIDTGLYCSVIMQGSADRIGTRFSRPISSHDAILAESITSLSDSIVFSFGNTRYSGRLPVMMLAERCIDIMIGWPDIKDQILIFDGEHRTLRAAGKLPVDLSGWSSLKMTSEGCGLIIDLPDGTAGTVYVDTGSPEGVSLPPVEWKRWKDAHPKAPIGSIQGQYMDRDPERLEGSWADELVVGPVKLAGVSVQQASQHDLQTYSDYAGTLGLAALERMDLILDADNRRAYIREKRAQPSQREPTWPNHDYTEWTVAGALQVNTVHIQANTLHIQGLATYVDGDFRKAEIEQTRSIELDPQNVGAFMARAVARTRIGDIQGAASDFAIVEKDRPIASVYLSRALAKEMLADHQGAIADLGRVIELDPRNQVAYLDRGNIRHNLGDDPAALADFTKALELNPSDEKAYNNRGYLYFLAGKLQDALDDYSHAIELHSQYTDALVNRGNLHDAQGAYDAAIEDFDRVLAYDPDNAGTLYYRGSTRMKKQDVKGALADWTRVIEISPKLQPAYYVRGRLLQQLARFDEAIADYDRAIALRPERSPELRLYRHVAQLKLGIRRVDLDDANVAWPDVWLGAVDQFLRAKIEEPALFTAATSDAPLAAIRTCQASYYAGIVHLINHDTEGARKLFEQVTQSGEKSADEFAFANQELLWMTQKSSATQPAK